MIERKELHEKEYQCFSSLVRQVLTLSLMHHVPVLDLQPFDIYTECLLQLRRRAGLHKSN